jgi:hypothetical protein
VEFGLALPILLVLLVTVADFGRIFATGIVLESAARDAAEVVANSYLADPPPGGGAGDLSLPAPPGDPTYYGPLHLRGARVVCAETRDLPNTNYDTSTTDCPGMPLIQICIHDSQDTDCAAEPYGATIPAECGDLATAPTNGQDHGPVRYVEVRLCYHFTSLLNVPIVPLADFWLQRTRTFTIPCYFVLGTNECG